MIWYMRLLGVLLILLGASGSWVAWEGLEADDAYFRAVKGVEKYPGNVLYQTELKMAEPRHMLLLGAASAAAPTGFVLGSICLGVAATLAGLRRLENGSS